MGCAISKDGVRSGNATGASKRVGALYDDGNQHELPSSPDILKTSIKDRRKIQVDNLSLDMGDRMPSDALTHSPFGDDDDMGDENSAGNLDSRVVTPVPQMTPLKKLATLDAKAAEILDEWTQLEEKIEGYYATLIVEGCQEYFGKSNPKILSETASLAKLEKQKHKLTREGQYVKAEQTMATILKTKLLVIRWQERQEFEQQTVAQAINLENKMVQLMKRSKTQREMSTWEEAVAIIRHWPRLNDLKSFLKNGSNVMAHGFSGAATEVATSSPDSLR